MCESVHLHPFYCSIFSEMSSVFILPVHAYFFLKIDYILIYPELLHVLWKFLCLCSPATWEFHESWWYYLIQDNMELIPIKQRCILRTFRVSSLVPRTNWVEKKERLFKREERYLMTKEEMEVGQPQKAHAYHRATMSTMPTASRHYC